jgi:DNA polymerase-3 subunit beta
MPNSDFPRLYDERGELIAEMDEKDLRRDFSTVVFSASIDTTRPALSGVLVRREAEGFLLVATDGFRLSLQHYKLPNTKTDIQKSFIVPARVFRELLSIKEEKKKVEMYITETGNQILFQQGETVLIGRLIEAEFPNFEKIIPTDFSLSIVFDREEMQKAVKICSIFARDSANIVKLNLRKDHITVSSSAPSVGENTVDVDAVLTGEENEIAFNAKYLLDLFSNLSENELVFEMIGPLNPGVFKIKGDASFLHLIMPIRTGQ